MSDDSLDLVERSHSGVFIALVGFAVMASAAGLIWSYTLENRLEKSQAALVTAQQQNDKLAESLNETNAKLRVTSETLGQSVGLTQRQLEARASEFLKRQQAETARLEKEQQAAQAESAKQIGAVSTDVSAVGLSREITPSTIMFTRSQLSSTWT